MLSVNTDIVTCCSNVFKTGVNVQAIVLKVPKNFSDKQYKDLQELSGVQLVSFDECLDGRLRFRTLVLRRIM